MLKKLLNYPCFYFFHTWKLSKKPSTVRGKESWYWEHIECEYCSAEGERLK